MALEQTSSIASSAGVEDAVLGLFVNLPVERGAASTLTQVCGDGVREGSEECDDGNNTPGDSCSETCRNEVRTVTPEGEIVYMPPVATVYNLSADVVSQGAATVAPPAPTPPKTTDSGPAAIAVMAAGAAAGFGWMRRKKQKA